MTSKANQILDWLADRAQAALGESGKVEVEPTEDFKIPKSADCALIFLEEFRPDLDAAGLHQGVMKGVFTVQFHKIGAQDARRAGLLGAMEAFADEVQSALGDDQTGGQLFYSCFLQGAQFGRDPMAGHGVSHGAFTLEFTYQQTNELM